MTTVFTREIKELLQSQKFRNWSTLPDKIKPGDVDPAVSVSEKHFTPDELAEAWGVSAETIRNVFRNEPGVLRLTQADSSKRKYVLLRIPESVATRVHRRLSAVAL